MTSRAAHSSPPDGLFDVETSIVAQDDGTWRTRLSPAWHIGDTANGGYALTPVLRALATVAEHPDPLSVTTHFLRPSVGGLDGTVRASPVRVGRTTGVARGELAQDGRDRLHVTAVFGQLDQDDDVHDDGGDDRHDDDDGDGDGPRDGFAPPPPDDLPPPEACVDRRELGQGVELPILSRVDVRIHPQHASAGAAGRAVIAGWIRFTDGAPPTTTALPLFADAFPPSLYPLLGRVGWVPTIELTVHVRRRPAAGWIRARFECDDLQGGRMIESGTLWDADDRVVARSRQLGLHLPP